MKIVVTGYRKWSTARSVFEIMDHWLEWPYEKNVVATGACPTGADAYAKALCVARGVPLVEFHAMWSNGKKAGPERNALMIDIMKPDLVLAFLHPESKGTVQCVRYARTAGYKVLEIWEGQGGTSATPDADGSG